MKIHEYCLLLYWVLIFCSLYINLYTMVLLLQWVFSPLSSLSIPITWVSAHVAGSSWSNAQTPRWLLMHHGCLSMCYGVYFCNITICFWNQAIYCCFKLLYRVRQKKKITAYCHLSLYLRERLVEPKWMDFYPEFRCEILVISIHICMLHFLAKQQK